MKTKGTQNNQKQKLRKSSISISRRRYNLRKGSVQKRLAKSSNTVDSTTTPAGPQAPPPCLASSVYSPLDEEKEEFRLLTLFAGADSDAIECRVDVYSTESCPEFEALSYYWGDPTPTAPITINGVISKISHNLGVALPYLRHPHSDRILWIDAICINQVDISERNHQVRLMHRVYSIASTVLIWLGEALDDGDAVMDLIRENSTRNTKSLDLAARTKIYSFLDRPWWSRMWIVQEVALAKSDPMIMCGQKTLPWTKFMTCYNGVVKLTFEITTVAIENNTRRLLLGMLRTRLQSVISKQKSLNLCGVLARTKDFETSDPRDKVYGCLGLVNDDIRDNIQPDYHMSVDEVYLAATKQILQQHKTGAFFSMFSFYNLPRKSRPSWVPDFAHQRTSSPRNPELAVNPEIIRGILFPRQFSVKEGGRLLEIRGVVFDTVDTSLELKSPDRLLSQIVDLEKVTSQLPLRPLPPLHPVRNLERGVDIINLLMGIDKTSTRFRREYDYWTWKSGLRPCPQNAFSLEEESEFTRGRSQFKSLMELIPKRYFFSTNLGFAGVSVCPVRRCDVVTFLGGEWLPTILRPRGLSYTVVGSAPVQGIMSGELKDLYKRGLVQETTFAIRGLYPRVIDLQNFEGRLF